LNKEEIISSGLLELYATGIASPEEIRLVEQALLQYPALKAELNEIENSLERYTQAQAIEPSDVVKEKIFNQLAVQPAKKSPIAQIIPITRKVYRIPQFFRILTAILLILLVESVILIYSFYNKYHHTLNDLQLARHQVQQMETSNEAMTSDMRVMMNKDAMSVVLNGTPKAPDAMAKLFWMKNTGEVYISPASLPETPAGKEYQLWAIVDGQPQNAGMIQAKNGNYHMQKMKSFRKADAFAITLENTGGSPAPTMDQMIVFSKI
jgi:Anti-sigma-K factor rskA